MDGSNPHDYYFQWFKQISLNNKLVKSNKVMHFEYNCVENKFASLSKKEIKKHSKVTSDIHLIYFLLKY